MSNQVTNSSSSFNKWKTRVSKAVLAAKFAQGDLYSGTQLAYESARDWINKTFPSGMAPRKPRPKRIRRKKRNTRRRNGFMGVSKIPCRRVVPYAATAGSKHRWYFNVKLSLFDKAFTSTYQDFKMLSLKVRYLPNNSTSETGLYTAVLLDNTGFGAYGAATAASWFTTIGAMPGAKIRARYIPSVFNWKPTEPSAREWNNKSQDPVYCTIYICNNGQENDELGGMLEISGTMLARGLFYNAAVTSMAQDNPLMFPDHPVNLPARVHNLRLDAISPPQPSSRPSSRGSLVSPFHVIG